MSNIAVELRGVDKSYGAHAIVRELSLAVPRGEFFSLLGPSGCGKTTCLRMIAGFEQPNSGEVLLNGQCVNGTPPPERDVNLVFQGYALFPHMTVHENVAFGLRMQKIPAPALTARVEQVLRLARLENLEQRYPGQLSGGQQQRVALARALVTQPSLVLLDEPLGALDLKLRKEMQFELKRIQRELGMTFLYVTHDQEEALVLSDRIAVMHDGRILQVGAPAEIYERPVNRFVADFIGETNFLEGNLTEAGPGYATVSVNGVHIKARRGDDAGEALAAGAAVVLAIRPEKILLNRGQEGRHDNLFEGTIEDALYLGTDMQYSVRVSDDVTLTVRQQNAVQNDFRRGQKVYLGWPAQAAAILPYQSQASG